MGVTSCQCRRESVESWADLLRDCARRGMRPPVLAVGDGALGFRGALREVFPATRQQRCWFHKIANVPGALPKSAHPGAKKAMAEIWNAEDRRHALDVPTLRSWQQVQGAAPGKIRIRARGREIDDGVMTTKRTPPQSHHRRPLVVFFALTFLFGWGALASLIAFGGLMEPVFGPPSGTHPVFVLAVYSPEFAALYIIWREGGLRDVRDHLRRLTLWRMPAGWWWFLLLAMPAGKYLSALLNGTAGEFPFSPWYMVLPALILALLLGPIEELGWRGYAQPMLQRRFNPFVTSLILGFFWGLWHLPVFLLSGTPQSAWSFGPFMLGAFALSIIMTPLFNVSRGSILIPALFHFQANIPAYPEGQPWENYVFALVAVVMVIWKRDHFFSRDGAVTDVVLRPR